jgi:L-threonylcarbamoyladenylate synthase
MTTELERAAAAVRAGSLVAFPTETVYGLGADALNPDAVRRIFEVKGRPATSPLIVHVDTVEMARSLALVWPPEAEALAGRHWPGPLTLVVEKQGAVPDEVTAGLGTVGLRMPAHPMALDLIRLAGRPIAAPSANRFSGLSPTSAEHVRAAFGSDVEIVLDGGPCPVGIESTVVSVARRPAVLLRPGMISREEIQELAGEVELGAAPGEGGHASPGLHARHYSPRTRLLLVRGGTVPGAGRGAYLKHGISMPATAREYAAAIYSTLHGLDLQGLDWIAVEEPPEAPEWAGIRDRLRRAATAP